MGTVSVCAPRVPKYSRLPSLEVMTASLTGRKNFDEVIRYKFSEVVRLNKYYVDPGGRAV
jgi:hypothetical protein